jgi:hypothetical protein
MVCFQTKNSNLCKFSRALDWKNGYSLCPFGIFYGHLGYFMTIWYILYSFGKFFLVLVSWTNKHLATLYNTLFTYKELVAIHRQVSSAEIFFHTQFFVNFLTNFCNFLTNFCNFLTNICNFLTNICKFLTNFCNFLTNFCNFFYKFL